MKKKSILAILAAAAIVLAGCSTGQKEVNNVGTDIAKAAALKAAGLENEEVAFSAAELNDRNGQEYYAVDFTYKGQKYSCDIDALTGKVINYRAPEAEAVKLEATSVPNEQNATAAKDAAAASKEEAKKELIGEAKAKEIALKHAGLSEDQIVFVRCALDWDDGRQEYEVEFYTKDYKEYDYDIDAYTGEIRSFDQDAENYKPQSKSEAKPEVKQEAKSEAKPESKTENSSSGNSANKISEAKAKEIALAQVPGATKDNIREFEVDYDDGRLEYEGKIIFNDMEYEFEIDGYSGAIRNWEVESVFDD